MKTRLHVQFLLVVFAVALFAGSASGFWPFPKPWKWSSQGVTFAPQKVGDVVSPTVITLTNTGSNPLAVKIHGVDGPFGAQMNGSDGYVLGPKSDVAFHIEFHPPSIGKFPGSLQVDVSGTIETIPLYGEGK